MKAIKNETEIAGFRSAMLKDGIALVKFLRWLKPAGSGRSDRDKHRQGAHAAPR